jgi:hypothetical protein
MLEMILIPILIRVEAHYAINGGCIDAYCCFVDGLEAARWNWKGLLQPEDAGNPL